MIKINVNNTFFLMEFGSHVYGTNLPTSDHDYKGLFLPESRKLLLGSGKETITTSTKPSDQAKNSADDTDMEYFTLKQYMKLLLEGQTVALTMLFAPSQNIILASPIYHEIVANRQRLLHSGVSAFAGYCRGQANKYGIKGSRVAAARKAVEFFGAFPAQTKLREIWENIVSEFTNTEHCEFLEAPGMFARAGEHPVPRPVRMLSICNRKVQEHVTVKDTHKIYKHLFDEYGARALQAENNENVDWKALMHAVRVACEAYELLTTHHITYPRPEAALLLQIRKAELPYQQVADIIEEGLLNLEKAQAQSTLPAHPDTQWADDFIEDQYSTHVVNYYCDPEYNDNANHR